ncbi:MAG: exodeoxyribonuclease VII small subunit [Bdellovibrionota bacterium]
MSKKQSEAQSYQKMLQEVETIVEKISSNAIDLDDMVKDVERGYLLVKTMRERLSTTKEKIEKLRLEYSSEDG